MKRDLSIERQLLFRHGRPRCTNLGLEAVLLGLSALSKESSPLDTRLGLLVALDANRPTIHISSGPTRCYENQLGIGVFRCKLCNVHGMLEIRGNNVPKRSLC